MGILKRMFFGVLINGVALFGVTYFLKDVTYTGGFMFFLIGGVVIGVLNTLVKPFMELIAFPFIIFTAGLIIFIINAFILWFTKYFLDVIQFRDVAMEVSGIGGYVTAAVLFGLINWGLHLVIKNK